MQAKLPFDREEKTIGSMFPGETGYTVPWAIMVDLDRLLWLRGSYTIHESTGGTVQMEVHRNTKGYEVKVPQDQMYSLQRLDALEHKEYDLRPVTKASWKTR